MSNKAVNLTVLDSGVALITIDVPNERMNTFSPAVMQELASVVSQVGYGQHRGLIITAGESKPDFGAGANVEEIANLQRGSDADFLAVINQGKAVLNLIRGLSITTVAALHGYCLGGFAELALACKRRIGVGDIQPINPDHDEHKKKQLEYGFPEVGLGLFPGWNGIVESVPLVGVKRAVARITSPAPISAKEAWEQGFIDEITSYDQLISRSEQVALGAKPKRYHHSLNKRGRDLLHLMRDFNTARKGRDYGDNIYLDWLLNSRFGRGMLRQASLAAAKKLTYGRYPAPLAAIDVAFMAASKKNRARADNAEAKGFVQLAQGNVSRNMVRLYLNKQRYQKSHLTYQHPLKIGGVIGAGTMGADIAEILLYAGLKVVLLDIKQEMLDSGYAHVMGLIDKLVRKGKVTTDQAEQMKANLTMSLDYASLANCDFMIEAVSERVAVKQSVFAKWEAVKQPHAKGFSNTSGKSIDEIVASLQHPEDVAGLHFFNPATLMEVVEIISGSKTSDETLSCALNLGQLLKKISTPVANAPCFLINAILSTGMHQTAVLLEAGVPALDIERAMLDFGMKQGTVSLLDTVGMDIAFEVVDTLHQAWGGRMAPPALLGSLLKNGILGHKAGAQGCIFVYDQKGKPVGVNPAFAQLVTAQPRKMMKEAIQERIVLAWVAEAIRCLEKGIITDPQLLDLAFIFSTGFAYWSGGPLCYADQLGLQVVKDKLDLLYASGAGENYRAPELLCQMVAEKRCFYSDN